MGDTNIVVGKASLNTPERNNHPSSKSKESSPQTSAWQIPRGVSHGNWDYVRTSQIASGYDQFLEGDPLNDIDRQIINRYLPPLTCSRSQSEAAQRPIIADFGCGTGRTLLPLVNAGYRGVAIDLSIPMLTMVKEKFEINFAGQATNAAIEPAGQSDDLSNNDSNKTDAPSKRHADLVLLQANLVELDGLNNDSIDHGISLFSTLGMIQGANHRARFLEHVRRVIKPGGQFILHAHNAWFQLRHPGGIRWAVNSAMSQLSGKGDFGDRTAQYRGVNEMFIHSFRKSELNRALDKAGFKTQKWFGVLPGATSATENFPFASSLSMVGWVIVCA